MPNTNLENPYAKQKKQCILCKYNIEVNYKNPRLLSQFVSPFTGLLYNKHITGLCTKQQQLVERELRLAKYLGLMPYVFRDARFCKDPRLFNPLRPQRPNPY
ncbi:28S ribosomal protein S18c-like protein, partial [Dinothrombium tinctorium]